MTSPVSIQALNRLVNVDCKALPTLQPLNVFLRSMVATDAKTLGGLDDQLLDFVTFRNEKGAGAQRGGSVPVLSREAGTWPPRRDAAIRQQLAGPSKRFVMFCDTSILFNRQLPLLQQSAFAATAAGGVPENDAGGGGVAASDVVSFVFPFSALLLLRLQAAQADSGAVSNAFRVSVYSQLHQFSHMVADEARLLRDAKQSSTAKPSSAASPPLVSVLPPSIEAEMLRSALGLSPSSAGGGAVELLPTRVAEKSILGGEVLASAFLLPRLALAAQRAFGKAEGKSCVAAVGSAHSAVSSVCIRSGILCDSLQHLAVSGESSSGADSLNDGGSSSSTSSDRRFAAAQCRMMVRRLQEVAPRDEVTQR
jgi:hypothetical protein